MADMCDKGEVTRLFAFRSDSIYAKINVTFRIDSGVDQSSASVQPIKTRLDLNSEKDEATKLREKIKSQQD